MAVVWQLSLDYPGAWLDLPEEPSMALEDWFQQGNFVLQITRLGHEWESYEVNFLTMTYVRLLDGRRGRARRILVTDPLPDRQRMRLPDDRLPGW